MNEQTVIEGVRPPPPPKRTTEMVRTAVQAYIERHGFDWGDSEDAAREISNHWTLWMDGYELAKALDDFCGWDICAEDVENLDNITSVVREAEEEARKAWVAQWNIKPPLPVGTKIKEGVITGVCEYMAAVYEVKETGRTQEGMHLLIKFEDAQAQENDFV